MPRTTLTKVACTVLVALVAIAALVAADVAVVADPVTPNAHGASAMAAAETGDDAVPRLGAFGLVPPSLPPSPRDHLIWWYEELRTLLSSATAAPPPQPSVEDPSEEPQLQRLLAMVAPRFMADYTAEPAGSPLRRVFHGGRRSTATWLSVLRSMYRMDDLVFNIWAVDDLRREAIVFVSATVYFHPTNSELKKVEWVHVWHWDDQLRLASVISAPRNPVALGRIFNSPAAEVLLDAAGMLRDGAFEALRRIVSPKVEIVVDPCGWHKGGSYSGLKGFDAFVRAIDHVRFTQMEWHLLLTDANRAVVQLDIAALSVMIAPPPPPTAAAAATTTATSTPAAAPPPIKQEVVEERALLQGEVVLDKITTLRITVVTMGKLRPPSAPASEGRP